MTEKINEKMPTRGIRMPDELWKTCIEMSKELADKILLFLGIHRK